MRPYSEACEQNKDAILAVLHEVFAGATQVLEIGSGTGQHAVYFATHLPHLVWQPTDLPVHHSGIRAWIDATGQSNVRPPLALDVAGAWPHQTYDAVFSANTLHILRWSLVADLIAGAGRVLVPGGRLVLYGPFNYQGHYTSASNARFDAWLKARDPHSGVRDFEAVDELARSAGLDLLRDFPMPTNNRTLVWHKRTAQDSARATLA